MVKRETQLKILGLGWCIPFFLLATPFIVLAVTCDRLEDFFTWARRKTEDMSETVGNALCPPDWWPSHKYLAELNELRAARRKEQVDRLHSRLHKATKKPE